MKLHLINPTGDEGLKDFVASLVHEAVSSYNIYLGSDAAKNIPWSDCTPEIKESMIEGIDRIMNNPDMTPEEIHDNWMESKLSDGWIAGSEKDFEKKIHPDLVPYESLSEEAKIKDLLFINIVKSFM